MTKKEVVQILAILKAAYPNSYKMTTEEASGTINIWYMQFANIAPDIVLMAVNKHISSNKFPPSIYEIKLIITSIHWEAYDALNSYASEKLSEQAKKNYQRIYNETKNYKYEKSIAPTLQEMIGAGAQLMIGGETE